ncbi:MAG: flagellar hook-length control protein FliK [Planctomycetes bacterium]|nr:flagellar hook-length control protein FliK [Planctomycetota bacterium]
MPETMVDIFDKSSALGNVFNKAVSSADGVNSGCAGEGTESDGVQKFVLFQEILGQQMTRDAPGSVYPPQKSGKPVVTPGVVGTQKEALTIPLPTGDKLQATKLQVGKEGIKGATQAKGNAEINYSVINEQILNGIFSANMPLQLATGAPSNPQIIKGESGLQIGNIITGNGANVASTLFTSTMETPVGIGDETGNAFHMADNQSLLATAVKGASVEGLNLSAAASATFANEATAGIDTRLDNASSMVNNQSLQAIAGNKDFYGAPVEEKGVNGKELGFEILKDTGNLQMASKSGINNIPLSQLLRNGQPPSSPIKIQGREFQGLDTGAVMSRVPGVYALPTQVSSSLTVNEQPTKELSLPNATDPHQGKHIYREEGASTTAFGSQQDGGQEAFEDQPEEPDILDFASLETSAQKTPGDLSVTINTQPTKELRSPNHLELQHNAFISHGNNTTQPSSVEGSDGVMSYLRHDRTDTTGQTQADIMDQLFQRISLATHGDRSEIKLHLTPPELGKVKIHFVEENNEVEAKIFVENAEVKATIENNVHHLRESIASSGIGIHKLEVYLQNEDTNKQKSLEDFSANNFGRQNQGQRHTGEGKNYFGEGKTDDNVANRESGTNASNFIIDYIS